MKKFFLFIFLLIFITGAVFSAWIGYFLFYPTSTEATLYFKRGSSLRQISATLRENNLIKSTFLFVWMARLEGKGGRLKPGEYSFEAGLNSSQILSKIVEGKVVPHNVTIPEGYNLQEIGKVLIEKGLLNADQWKALVADDTLITSLKIPGPTLEGYLFPSTYAYDRETTPQELISHMVDLFFKKIAPLNDKLQERGLSLKEWVTLASIVEKETARESERPIIAEVFLNRIREGMPLQTDPTVIYGIPNFNGNITKQDLETDTPYNTYIRTGLPPGPICSPGLSSLRAVLNATPTHYLYFVSKGDGTHYFSQTLEEHNQAVNYYQLHQGNPPVPGSK